MYLPDFEYAFSENLRGGLKDLQVLDDELWLHDSEVKYYIEERSNQWYLNIIYVWIKNPRQFLCKFIDSYYSLKKAELYAQIFQRSIRKDARGTLKTNENAYDICFN